MTSDGGRRGWPGPEYVTRRSFRAPLPFVFEWCTDYSPLDPKLEKDRYVRKILRRTPRSVVYEDLEESREGWYWARYDISLKPPNRWHVTSVGNTRRIVGDYKLTRLAGGRTGFELRYRRKPGLLQFERVSKSRRQRDDARTWSRFARALERDYRASVRSPSRKRGRWKVRR